MSVNLFHTFVFLAKDSTKQLINCFKLLVDSLLNISAGGKERLTLKSKSETLFTGGYVVAMSNPPV